VSVNKAGHIQHNFISSDFSTVGNKLYPNTQQTY